MSPLLFVAAVQPLAARLRRLQAAGRIDAISLPGGAVAPPSHQHADDTTIHTATAAGIAGAISLAVQPFCAASASHLNTHKCIGLTLGSHPPIQGVHAASGITFAAPGTIIRHLGILLTTGSRAAAAEEAWQRRVSAVAASIRHWSHVDLTLLGRAHVAKQVLGNQLPFLATFVEPPQRWLTALQRMIDGFTMRGPRAGGADTAVPLRARPAQAAATLPRAEGGLSAPDIAMHCVAMRAKVGAALLHPQRRPWKVVDGALLEAALPGVGAAALLTRLRPTGRGAAELPPRIIAYWAALMATAPHRQLPPEEMTPQQIAWEPLAGNARVAPPGGEAARTWLQAGQQWGACRRLADLAAAAAAAAAAPECRFRNAQPCNRVLV